MAQKLPNIVVLLAGDLGVGDVGLLNRQSKIRTPHMDRVGREGMVFGDAHSSAAVATPSCYGLLTGRYAFRTRLKQGVLGGYAASLIEPGRLTLASMLRQQGYRTACIGKWHLGLGWRMKDGVAGLSEADAGADDPGVDFTAPLTDGPHTLGFDESYVIPASLDMPPYVYVQGGRVTATEFVTLAESPQPAYRRAGVAAKGFEPQTCLLELTRRAEAFIDHHAQTPAGRPMLLYIPMPSVQPPHLPRQSFVGSNEIGAYGDLVAEHDWSVGQILATLDRNGMAENTVVVVSSSNGASTSVPGLMKAGHQSNGPLRGQKGDCWEGGHRVPLLVRWPGGIRGGSECGQVVCLTDLMATFAELAGVALPDESAEDSFSLMPLLGGENRPIRETLVHHSVLGHFAIRNDRWKMIACRGSGGWSLQEKDVPADAPAGQLYDMADKTVGVDGLGEVTNLYDSRVWIANGLQAMLEKCINQGRSR